MSVSLSVGLLLGCASPAPAPSNGPPEAAKADGETVVRKTNRVLVMATGYVDPGADTAGLNTLTDNVTQAFSRELQPLLAAAGKTPVNVNDKAATLASGQKMAAHAARSDADAAVVLRIDTAQVDGQASLQLKVQYHELRYVVKDGATVGVVAANGLERSYYLRGARGDTSATIDELAANFMGELKAAGRLN